MIVNVYRYDKNNVGDLWSAPSIYYKDLQGPVFDILSDPYITDQTILLGGGGLISPTFIDTIKKLSSANRIISWGIGENWYINTDTKYYSGPKYIHTSCC